MNVIVFGASGKTGLEIVEEALARGHHVRAFVRSPNKLGDWAERVEVLRGDVLDGVAVARAIRGQDAILSAVGYVAGADRGFMSSFARHLITHTSDTTPVVTLLGALISSPDEPRHNLGLRLTRAILGRLGASIFSDLHAHANLLRDSDLEYVIVRPPRLTSGPRTRRVCDTNTPMPFNASLSRKDLATYMLDQIEPQAPRRRDPIVYQVS